MRDWDKVLLLTLLRCYKKMSRPVPQDYSRIYSGISISEYYSRVTYRIKFIQSYNSLGLPRARRVKEFFGSKYDLKRYLSASIIGVRRISAVGPRGNSLLSRVLDLINVLSKPLYVLVLDIFTWRLRVLAGGPSRPTPHHPGKVGTLLWYLKPFKLLHTKLTLRYCWRKPKIYHRMKDVRVNRLSSFVDGLGK